MSRFAALLLGCALGAVVAAPAPFPRPPKVSSSWYEGWDKPEAPHWGDCRLDRQGDRLTITLPGDENYRGICLCPPPTRDPRLLRDVEGDFAIEVKLEGQVRSLYPDGCNRAGLVIRDGSWSMWAGLAGEALLIGSEAPYCLGQFSPPSPIVAGRRATGVGEEMCLVKGLPVKGTLYLQLRRRGNKVVVAWGPDAEGRTRDVASLVRRYPRRVKVGVYATSTLWPGFKAEFVNLRLSRGGK